MKTVFRGPVPAAGLALLLALAAASGTARAENECGVEANNAATCGADTGDFDGGVYYQSASDGGFKLTIEARTNNAAREIKNAEYDDSDDSIGHGILVIGTSGQGTLELDVQGDTNIVRRAAPSQANPRITRNGIHMENTRTNNPVLGSVVINIGAEVDIGAEGEPFQNYGIRAIAETKGSASGTPIAGVKITNAGNIYSVNRGIRAHSVGRKTASPPAGHLNGKVEVTHSGTIDSGSWGIHAISGGNAEVVVTVAEGGTIKSATRSTAGGIYAATQGGAGDGGSGNVSVSSAGDIDVDTGRGIVASVLTGTGTVSVTFTGATLKARPTESRLLARTVRG